MLWTFSDGPIPGPLVTTSTNPGTPTSGALGQAATKVLYGTSNLDYGTFEGRPPHHRPAGSTPTNTASALRSAAFPPEQRSTHFQPLLPTARATSASRRTSPPLNTALNREDSFWIVSDPVSQFRRQRALGFEPRLWGIEANGIIAAVCSGCDCYHVEFLAGIRHIELDVNR